MICIICGKEATADSITHEIQIKEGLYLCETHNKEWNNSKERVAYFADKSSEDNWSSYYSKWIRMLKNNAKEVVLFT